MVNSRLSDSVEVLKGKIQAMSAIPIEQQRLIFRGRVLENNKTLRECDLENEDTIFLVKQTPHPPASNATDHGPSTPNLPNAANAGVPNLGNVVTPLMNIISNAVGSIINHLPQEQHVNPVNTSAPSHSSDPVDDVLDEVFGSTEHPVSPNPPPSSTQPSQGDHPSPADSLIRNLNESSQSFIDHSSQDATVRAVNTYLCNLQQYAAYLQRKLRESNINATAWSQMQQAMQDHVTFTQSLMRLPAPAPNRGELQRVDVIATTIPMAVGQDGQRRLDTSQLTQLFQQLSRGNAGNAGNAGNTGNGSNAGNTGNGSNANNGNSGNDNEGNSDVNGMYL